MTSEYKKAYMREWRAKNATRLKEYNKTYHLKWYPLHREERLAYLSAWRGKNLERKKEMDRVGYLKRRQNPEWVLRERKRGKMWSEKKLKENPNYWNEIFRKRYRENPGFRAKKIRYVVEYVKRNPIKKYIINHNYRARRRNANGSFTLQEWNEILSRYNNACAFCGTQEKITIDHIIPLSRNGTNFANNLQPLCRSCNAKKHNNLIQSLTTN